MTDTLKVLGIPGSLRKGAWSKAVLHATALLVPSGMMIDRFDLDGIPPFNQDDEKNPPAAVRELKTAIRAADAVLFVTPEYNYGVPGVLKNAIDAASRPYGDSAWRHKPVNVISNAPSALGGVKAMIQLKQSFAFLEVYQYVGPEMVIASVHEKIGPDGGFSDEKTKQMVRDMLRGFREWIRLIKSSGVHSAA